MINIEDAEGIRLPRAVELLLLLAVLSAVFFIYRGALHGFFVQDDYGWLFQTRFQNLSEYAQSFFRFNPARAYRPLSQETFFWLGQAAFGMRPFWFHCVSMFFFLSGGALVYVLLRQFLPLVPSLAGALFYSAHGAHFRSVYWISALPEPMALFFFVGAVVLFIHFDRRNARWAYALSFISMALGICAKESILTLPIVLALYSAFFSPRRVLWTLPHFMLSGLYTVLRLTSHAAGASPYPLSFGKEAWSNLLTYLSWSAGFSETLRQAASSANLNLSYLLVGAIAAIVLAVLLYVASNRRLAFFGFTWYLAALQPVLYFQKHIDPYYLAPALAGLALTISAAIPSSGGRRRWKTFLSIAVLAGYSTSVSSASVSREGSWWNERADLGRRILRQMPDIDRQFPAGHIAYIFGFGEWEFGVMQNDAAFKAYGYSPHTRFILVGQDPQTPRQIRQLQQNGGLDGMYCFVYEKGKLVNRSEEFRRDPGPFLAMTGDEAKLGGPEAEQTAQAGGAISSTDRTKQVVAGYQLRPEVRLEVSPREAVAGKTVLTLRTIRFDVPAIDVLYSIDGELMPVIHDWRFDKNHKATVYVSNQTQKGRYRFLAMRDSRDRSDTSWIRLDIEVVVK